MNRQDILSKIAILSSDTFIVDGINCMINNKLQIFIEM